jgi:hypothetical protein
VTTVVVPRPPNGACYRKRMAAQIPLPFADPRRPRPNELRRWHAGYGRVASRQRELVQARGVDRQRAVRLSLDMLDAAFGPGNRTIVKDSVRLRGELAVRGIWHRLRSGYLP